MRSVVLKNAVSRGLLVLCGVSLLGLSACRHPKEAGQSNPRPDFTIVAVPDTQNYVSSRRGGLPETFVQQTDWIVANHKQSNFVYVAQLGDCVQNGDVHAEWQRSTNALYRLENRATTGLKQGIPYGVAVGNHDEVPEGNPKGSAKLYNQYFGKEHFSGYSYYGGSFDRADNDYHYDLFNASGLDFIVIYFKYDLTATNANASVYAWADKLLKQYPNRRAIVVSHYIIGNGDNAKFSGQGQAIYDALKGNPNLFLMLAGHITEEGQRVDMINGRSVWTLMSDYQDRINGGDGWLRLYEFSPTNNVIRVRTYSPKLGKFETDANSQFEIPYNMDLPSGRLP